MRPYVNDIGITTNGSLLYRRLERLQEAGVKSLNISLDSLVEAKNEFITRRHGATEKTIRSIDKALGLGLKVKLNVVAMNKFNCDELLDFVEFVKDR